MIKEEKKREIRKILRNYKNMLALTDYKMRIHFRTVKEDKELNNNYAIIAIDDDKKSIQLKLSSFELNRMKLQKIKKLCMHELLHSFFWELSVLFDEVVENCQLSDREREALKVQFDEIEHRRINHLVRVLLKRSSGQNRK